MKYVILTLIILAVLAVAKIITDQPPQPSPAICNEICYTEGID